MNSLAEVRIAASAYALPPEVEAVRDVLQRERQRVAAALRPLSPRMRQRAMEGLGLDRLHVCDATTRPYDLALTASRSALEQAGIAARDLGLIIDFSTLPGETDSQISYAQELCSVLGASEAQTLSYKVGGCGALHLAFQSAIAYMTAYDSVENVLLVTGDCPPAGNRSLLPITVQGDAGAAMVLRRGPGPGPRLLGTEMQTLSHLHDLIRVQRQNGGASLLSLEVDSARVERDLLPVYYLMFHRLMEKLALRTGLVPAESHHVVYSNLSASDQSGFLRAFSIPANRMYRERLLDLGHTFASDLIINYTEIRQRGLIEPGQLLLFASAGIGFTWGVTLARA
jgi:3-oxoacyl-[acyl-carrier-protein] synthase-3